jgi:hypothetical protein
LSTIFLAKKQPTVITAVHLVDDTKQYVALIEFLLKIKVNVFSDYNTKKRWLNFHNPDGITEFINLKNEYNIIDEFDSHHNYLQSMFNYVKEKNIIIYENMFNYILDYVLE